LPLGVLYILNVGSTYPSCAEINSLELLTTCVIDSASINIIVNPLPIPNFNSNINFGGCLPFSPIFTNLTGSDGNGPGVVSAIWELGDGNTTDSLNSATNIYSQYGCYNVTLNVTTSEGCSADTTITNIVCK
jgi:PKD repeat protein